MLAQAGRKEHKKHTHIHMNALTHTSTPQCATSIYQQTLQSFSLQMSLCYPPSTQSLTDFLPSNKSFRPLRLTFGSGAVSVFFATTLRHQSIVCMYICISVCLNKFWNF